MQLDKAKGRATGTLGKGELGDALKAFFRVGQPGGKTEERHDELMQVKSCVMSAPHSPFSPIRLPVILLHSADSSCESLDWKRLSTPMGAKHLHNMLVNIYLNPLMHKLEPSFDAFNNTDNTFRSLLPSVMARR